MSAVEAMVEASRTESATNQPANQPSDKSTPPPRIPSAAGRLVFELRTGKGQWMRSGDTATSFLLPLTNAALAAGLAAPAPPAAAAPSPTPDEAASTSAAPASPRKAAGKAAAAAPKPDLPAATTGKKVGGASGRASGRNGGAAVGAMAVLDRPDSPAADKAPAAAAEEEEDDGWDEEAALAMDASWDIRLLLQGAYAAEEASAVPLGPVTGGVVGDVRGEEPKAERSLMHRFGIAADLVQRHCGALLGGGGAPGEERAEAARALAAVAVWLRFSSLRLLEW